MSARGVGSAIDAAQLTANRDSLGMFTYVDSAPRTSPQLQAIYDRIEHNRLAPRAARRRSRGLTVAATTTALELLAETVAHLAQALDLIPQLLRIRIRPAPATIARLRVRARSTHPVAHPAAEAPWTAGFGAGTVHRTTLALRPPRTILTTSPHAAPAPNRARAHAALLQHATHALRPQPSAPQPASGTKAGTGIRTGSRTEAWSLRATASPHPTLASALLPTITARLRTAPSSHLFADSVANGLADRLAHLVADSTLRRHRPILTGAGLRRARTNLRARVTGCVGAILGSRRCGRESDREEEERDALDHDWLSLSARDSVSTLRPVP